MLQAQPAGACGAAPKLGGRSLAPPPRPSACGRAAARHGSRLSGPAATGRPFGARRPFGASWPASRGSRTVAAASDTDDAQGPFPFEEEDYYQVEFVKEPYGPVAIDSAGSQWRGVLLFQVAGSADPVTEDSRILEIFISGDACISIYTHLCPSDNTRPMALDILWSMWQRGRSISRRDWTLLRVAVVACVNDVYYGRLFFGDPETQAVLWDCDVRPSDATFLALKAKAPIFVRKSVWEACSTPLKASSTWATVSYIESQRADKEQGGRGGADTRGSTQQQQQQQQQQQPSPDSLPAIRLLMREMEVAVREEDYEAAARIRDHPWMRIAEDINMHKSIGYYDQAYKLMADLKAQIEQHESATNRDYERRLAAQHQARAALDDLLVRQQDGGGAGADVAAPDGGRPGVQQNESSSRD